ncbi:S-adenosyl-L-methionine-dependent methyltransferase [Schizopora paradoxa]|uniref:S-adenosyl-L-methionine-dependent methyltransferase n=1 Tax=Schizopora paradoxa TaxID=27342 RepID=A0A0H2RNW9_9AGAM|nr:S-adenosyl-L-methionine-dependent methyltransferase [Schizopora paradoxa]
MTATTGKQEHSLAKDGFPKDGLQLYDQARPSYPAECLSFIRQKITDRTDLNVVEIGSGTGIFTRALLGSVDWGKSITEIKAVDPNADMREFFMETVKDDRVSVTFGNFQNTGISDEWADAIVIAQAFHWCVDYEGALQEFARILKPGGIVSFIWNNEDTERSAWVANLYKIHEAYEQGSPKSRFGLWRQVYTTPAIQLFQATEEKTFHYSSPATMDVVTNRFQSMSFIAAIKDPETKQRLVDDVREIVREGDEMVWIDKDAGTFEYPYQTLVFVAQKI